MQSNNKFSVHNALWTLKPVSLKAVATSIGPPEGLYFWKHICLSPVTWH